MKTILISTILYLLACSPKSKQEYIAVKAVSNYKYNDYQKPIEGEVYNVVAKTNNIDTLKLLKEYLSLEGDTRIFYKSVYCNNPKWSMRYRGKESRFSVQMYGLWKIHEIVYVNYKFLCPYPAIYNTENAQIETIQGKGISNAFNLYKGYLNKTTSFKEFKAQVASNSLSEKVHWYMGE